MGMGCNCTENGNRLAQYHEEEWGCKCVTEMCNQSDCSLNVFQIAIVGSHRCVTKTCSQPDCLLNAFQIVIVGSCKCVTKTYAAWLLFKCVSDSNCGTSGCWGHEGHAAGCSQPLHPQQGPHAGGRLQRGVPIWESGTAQVPSHAWGEDHGLRVWTLCLFSTYQLPGAVWTAAGLLLN